MESQDAGLGRGLDPVHVASWIGAWDRRAQESVSAIAEHFAEHQGYVAWSGGRDSTVVVDLARRARPDIPIVWFDSGLEFPDTEPYLRSLAQEWGLRLTIIKADPDALTILARSGLWDHSAALDPGAPDLHEALIAAPARRAHALFGPGEVSGLRMQESAGRRALLAPGKGRYRRADGTAVLAPVHGWTGRDIRSYLHRRGIPENPVYAALAGAGAPERAQRVGLVVDGNNPDFGRFTYLRLAYPDMWADLVRALPRLREWR